jgi:hypothetical protein
MSMMVMHDFLSKRITPLQDHIYPACLYTREKDTTWLERSRGIDPDTNVLETALSKLSTESSSPSFVTPTHSALHANLHEPVLEVAAIDGNAHTG